ncbi:MAG: DUF177 domain-containing protein [Trueperella sp.]|uniref:YceD family protein n=1 Tax=Trueperella sp. TaxID=2699835 RepID=UPI0025D38511|nr:DUF177 domain-containing protein [Trueperella sp.]MCI7306567.1 DUF177 domain-containing protein [Trueperella sp.]MDY5404538.1 DUF177 domain-containing protein [Trueperella sp.]
MTSPYIVSIVDLPRVEGAQRELNTQLPAPAECGIPLMGVPEGDPIDLDLVLQSVSEGVLVQGMVSAAARGQCARCLKDISLDLNEPVAELVLYPESRKALLDEGDEEAEDMPVVVDDAIDMEPIVRDALVLSIPLVPLCRPDCEGLCPECGERWEDLPPDHKHEFLDPRFSALDALAAQLSQEAEVTSDNAEERRA